MAKESANRVSLRETYSLPSAGKLYEGLIPETVTIRAMTTMDEKIRLSSSGFNAFVALLNSCIIEPENIDSSLLKMFDLQFLLYKLRTVTYGSKYDIRIGCPHCEKSMDVEVDLDELEVNSAGDDVSEYFEIGPLPVSGDTLTCRILSVGDIIEIEKESRKMLNKFKDYVGDPEFVLGYRYMIAKVNGEVLPEFKLMKYVEDMHARDLMYFDSIYEDKTDNIGIDTLQRCDCPACGGLVEFNLPINGEFFRPRYTV